MTSSANRIHRKYGPWAIVTGASSGIGRAAAAELADAGLNIILVARDEAALKKLAQDLAARGVQTRCISTDLSDRDAVIRLHETTGDLDIGLLVASAGFGTSGAFVDSSCELELNMLDVNCGALTANVHHFGRRMVDRGSGGIMLLSSIVAFQGNAHAAHYAATKAYVQTLAEGLSRELGPRGVDVLAVAPGPTESGFASRAGMKLGAAVSPVVVARQSLATLGRRTTVVPGLLSKLLKHSMFGLPRWIRVRIMSAVMRGSTQHQSQEDLNTGSNRVNAETTAA